MFLDCPQLARCWQAGSRVLIGGIVSVGMGVAWAADYHVDSVAGDDRADGRSPATAWRSLEKVNQQTFAAGDKVLLKAGSRFTGQLAPKGSGQWHGGDGAKGQAKTIVLARYGEGPAPRIDGEGKVADTLLLRNIEFWEVRDLEITNHGPKRAAWRTGVRVLADGFGPMRHLVLRNLYVHDVNGDLRKSHEGCGILFESKGSKDACFDGIAIEYCRVERTDRNGICQRAQGGKFSERVLIRHNVLEDIGGDGIKIWGSKGALVERNVVRGGRMRCQDAAAGIWPFASDDTVVQFNEVTGMKGIVDGQGFDSDYYCRNSLFQYNYSHNNEGGFMLICAPGKAYCDGTIIRYNISQNDGIEGARVFQFGGNSTNTEVYNNTIYVSPRQNLPMISCNEWNGGHASKARFTNNIFYVDGQVSYRFDKSRGFTFSHNVFYGKHHNPPNDAHASVERPPLHAPGTAKSGFASLSAYKLTGASGFPAGLFVPNNGAKDIFGRALPESKPPCRGAAEF